jgi:hypothetical protein
MCATNHFSRIVWQLLQIEFSFTNLVTAYGRDIFKPNLHISLGSIPRRKLVILKIKIWKKMFLYNNFRCWSFLAYLEYSMSKEIWLRTYAVRSTDYWPHDELTFCIQKIWSFFILMVSTTEPLRQLERNFISSFMRNLISFAILYSKYARKLQLRNILYLEDFFFHIFIFMPTVLEVVSRRFGAL